MKGTTLAGAIMIVGLVILFGGPLVLGALPAETYWDESDQAAYEQASTAAHAATYGGVHDHSRPDSHGATMDAEAQALKESTRAAFDREYARLQAAQASRKWLGIGCRVLGLLVSVGGLGFYLRSRRAAK